MKVEKQEMIFGALLGAAMAFANAAAPALAEYCANCQLQARQQAQNAISLSGLQEQAHTLLGFTQQDTSGIKINWDGKGDLPGSFQAPWHNPETNFDPSFRTPYWTMADGFTNAPSAPWNQFMPANYGSYFFNLGMKYVGPGRMAPLAPVWN